MAERDAGPCRERLSCHTKRRECRARQQSRPLAKQYGLWWPFVFSVRGIFLAARRSGRAETGAMLSPIVERLSGESVTVNPRKLRQINSKPLDTTEKVETVSSWWSRCLGVGFKVRFAPDRDRCADIADRQLCAKTGSAIEHPCNETQEAGNTPRFRFMRGPRPAIFLRQARRHCERRKCDKAFL
jgi:hypothetical protein